MVVPQEMGGNSAEPPVKILKLRYGYLDSAKGVDTPSLLVDFFPQDSVRVVPQDMWVN